MQFKKIPIDQLFPDPNQPRRIFNEQDDTELTASLGQFGQQVPMIVVPEGDGYLTIDGERRLRAGKRLSWPTMNAIVLEKRPDEAELLMLQLTVNCMRSDLMPLEKTDAYGRLIALNGVTPTELAKQLGVSKAYVTRYLSHDKLPENLKAMLRDGSLTSAKAYALSRMSEEQRSQAVADLDSKTTRDELERKARRTSCQNSNKSQIRNLRYELPDCTLALRISKSMTVDTLIDTLSDLLRACRKAKSQKLELGTMALVIRDRTRATKTDSAEVHAKPES